MSSAGFRGLESFTEDTNFFVGSCLKSAVCSVRGFQSHGYRGWWGWGNGAGSVDAGGESPFDLWPVDIRGFSSYHRSDRQLGPRVLEGQGHHYAMHWPHFEFQAGRPLRRSVLYDRLKESGACFGSKSGWERANWFTRDGEQAEDNYTLGGRIGMMQLVPSTGLALSVCFV
ncbi:MAG: hypothetical protein CM1200mP41_39640 [Gammaproteobacteria bacterium]|nr:MAG: hypothetical protein CM1200mP41_39640 [Gammaproteobacteria bacterium]